MSSSEAAKWGIDIPEYFNEDEVYEENDPKDPSPNKGPQYVDLYKQNDDDRDGAVKTTREGNPDGQLIYQREKSNYYLTVQRLAWLDGWRKTTGTGTNMKREDEMTLVVLKLIFTTSSRDSKIGFALVELRFHSDDKTGEDPKVEAWGPFRHPETWNPSIAQASADSKLELGATGGYNGTGVQGVMSRGEGLAWDKVDFDQGTSCQLFSSSKRKGNGVRWIVRQNELHSQGVAPEVRVAVLLSRPEREKAYRASCRLQTHTGTIQALLNAGQDILGLPAGDKIIWRSKPSSDKMRSCYAEGVRIAESIDTDNLGSLIKDPDDIQNLNPPWLNAWDRFEVSAAAAALRVESKTDEAISEVRAHYEPQEDITADHSTKANAARAAVNMIATTHAGGGWSAGEPTRGCLNAFGGDPGSFVPASVQPGPGAEDHGYSRLVSLEARAAQTEARLAAQDQLILKLQQALARTEQAISNGA